MWEQTYKMYQCKTCGFQKSILTNHYGECYSLGNYNACPNRHLLPPDPKRPQAVVRETTTWVCMEEEPVGDAP